MQTIILIRSLTVAHRASKLLSKNGIRSKLVKTDGIDKDKGCGFGIQISEADRLSATKILHEEEIQFKLSGNMI